MHDFDDEKCKPDAGLEPATVGLKVQRSTDWANQARKYVETYIVIICDKHKYFNIDTSKIVIMDHKLFRIRLHARYSTFEKSRNKNNLVDKIFVLIKNCTKIKYILLF